MLATDRLERDDHALANDRIWRLKCAACLITMSTIRTAITGTRIIANVFMFRSIDTHDSLGPNSQTVLGQFLDRS